MKYLKEYIDLPNSRPQICNKVKLQLKKNQIAWDVVISNVWPRIRTEAQEIVEPLIFHRERA